LFAKSEAPNFEGRVTLNKDEYKKSVQEEWMDGQTDGHGDHLYHNSPLVF